MTKILLTIATILILASHSIAADIRLERDVTKDATGYKLQISTDNKPWHPSPTTVNAKWSVRDVRMLGHGERSGIPGAPGLSTFGRALPIPGC